MKASKLRIGNYALYKGGIVIIMGINTDTFEAVDSEYNTISDNNIWLSGVSLTEEWLLKFDFKQNGIKWGLGNFYIANYDHIFGFDVNDNLGVNFKFVHQLQNLYFALTGEELTIK